MITIVKNVQEQLILVLNVFLEEMYHHIVNVHQENMKQKIKHVLIVIGSVVNVTKILKHVLHVEETEK